ncbi:uncharacterized protein [Panulirus ornatus]|uniref:uncharacterized protein isoform X3 n=1 Tax=Panulirus ornatus TaxID=150431 RepID=UPI003A892103
MAGHYRRYACEVGVTGGQPVDEVTRALQVGLATLEDGMKGTYRCNVCDQSLTSRAFLRKHLQSQKHEKKLFSTRPAQAQPPVGRPVATRTYGKVGVTGGQPVDEITRALQVGLATLEDDMKGTYRCNVCDQSLTSRAFLRKHLESQKHEKKLFSTRPAPAQPPVGRPVATRTYGKVGATGGQPVDEVTRALQVGLATLEDDMKGTYRCNVCDQSLTSRVFLRKHLESQKHEKKLFSTRPAPAQPPVGRPVATRTYGKVGATSGQPVDDVTRALQVGLATLEDGMKGTYRCNVCDQSLTSRAFLRKHLESQKHEKKVGVTGGQPGDEVTKALQVGLATLEDDMKGTYRCNVCDQSLTSRVFLRKHLESQKHEKKLFSTRPAPAQPPVGTPVATRTYGKVGATGGQPVDDVTRALQVGLATLEDDMKGTYRCNVCDQSLTSRAFLRKHLESQKHEKKLFSTRPAPAQPPVGRPVATRTYGKVGATGGQPVDEVTRALQVGLATLEDDMKGTYRCNVCDQSLTSRAFLKKHLESQKHEKKCVDDERCGMSPPISTQQRVLPFLDMLTAMSPVQVCATVDETSRTIQVGQTTAEDDGNLTYTCDVNEYSLPATAILETPIPTEKYQNKVSFADVIPPKTSIEMYCRFNATSPGGQEKSYLRPNTTSPGGQEESHPRPNTTSPGGQEESYLRPNTTSPGGQEKSYLRPNTTSPGGQEESYLRPNTTSPGGQEKVTFVLTRPVLEVKRKVTFVLTRPVLEVRRKVTFVLTRPVLEVRRKVTFVLTRPVLEVRRRVTFVLTRPVLEVRRKVTFVLTRPVLEVRRKVTFVLTRPVLEVRRKVTFVLTRPVLEIRRRCIVIPLRQTLEVMSMCLTTILLIIRTNGLEHIST